MTDLISRQAAIREYQEVCKGIKCVECPFLIKVNTEKGSHLITDCKLEAFLHDLPSEQPEIMLMYDELVKNLRDLSSLSDIAWREYAESGKQLINQAADAIEELSKPHWMPLSEPYKDVKYESNRK